MTYDAGFQHLQQELQRVYAKNEAAIVADWVMEHYTGKNKADRKITNQLLINGELWATLLKALGELLMHKPVQYVIGQTQFAGIRLLVNEAVLIPRPETEELVADIIEYINQLCRAKPESQLNILDIGTGSGCIPIALKKAVPHARVTAIDLMENALIIAQQNGNLNSCSIDWLLMNFLDENEWLALQTFDLIISNPPYIPLSEKNQLEKNVTQWEPYSALFVPDYDPLIFYRKIALFGQIHLKANGRIFLECHQNFANESMALFGALGYKGLLKKDIFGNNRFLHLTKAMGGII